MRNAGRRAEALRLLDELKRRQQKGYVPAGAFVNAYLGIDDKEQAFIWLERAFQEKSNIFAVAQSASSLRSVAERSSLCGPTPPRRP